MNKYIDTLKNSFKESAKGAGKQISEAGKLLDSSIEKISEKIDTSGIKIGEVVDAKMASAGKIADKGIEQVSKKSNEIKHTLTEKISKEKKRDIPYKYDFGDGVSDELTAVIEARKNMDDFIAETPCELSKRLSKLYGAQIYIKREDRTMVRSYKIRGAYNLISRLSSAEKEMGVVCASAGNHAQGFAITCAELKISGTVFMPITTPEQKVHKTRKFGGEFITVKLVGDTFDEAFAESKKFEKSSNATFVHPFDDPRIIEGQATIGLEVLKQLPEKPDYLICPIGGGGVSAGLVTVFSELSPQTKIIGVEPEGAPAMRNSLLSGMVSPLKEIDIFVDGAAVKQVGKNNFSILKDSQIDVRTVPENRVCTTILDYLKEDGIIVEPAGALSTDILKDLGSEIIDKSVLIIMSGGNFDFERLPEVKERSMKYEGLKRYFLVSFPQRPGALKDFLKCLGKNDDIARFEYLKKSNKNKAPVFIGIETDDKKNWEKICASMKKYGFKYNDITNDDLVFDLLV